MAEAGFSFLARISVNCVPEVLTLLWVGGNLGPFLGGLVPTVYARTLRCAAEIVGGDDVLAIQLGVSPKRLRSWINDLVRPPDDAFLAAADIVGKHELAKLELKAALKARSPRHG